MTTWIPAPARTRARRCTRAVALAAATALGLASAACSPGGRAGPGGAAPRDARPGAEAALTFPVAGHGYGSIGSWFGDSRDGGRRQHRGVDIFAPRGTAALAAADGVITDVATTPLGGRVIWMYSRAHDLTFYYAHLDEQLVRRGAHVRAGQEIGRVGNTGNARATPPHLHFGVYRPGRVAMDPAPLLRGARSGPVLADSRWGYASPAATAQPRSVGSWVRAAVEVVPIRQRPAAGAPILGVLLRNRPGRLHGASGTWYRIEVPDGPTGYVPARLVEDAW